MVIFLLRIFVALRQWLWSGLQKLILDLFNLYLRLRFQARIQPGFRPFRKKTFQGCELLFRRKPAWVLSKVLWLKAMHPDFGCRKIANEFNRMYQIDRGVGVGKTYVDDMIRAHRYRIEILSRQLKNRPPFYIPKNIVWGLDLTSVVEPGGTVHHVLGLVEHNTRVCLALRPLPDKSTNTILAVLREAIREAASRPKSIRTDNEAIFGPSFTKGLRRLGIEQQKTDKHSPWQNGRIERFFGTLQERMNHIVVDSFAQLAAGLGEFRYWYNNVRPHQALGGWTPAEAWSGRGALNAKPKSIESYSAWGGLLQGTLIRV